MKSTAAVPFPARLPPSLTDENVIAKHDWNAFGELKEMGNHWDRPGWGIGAERYYWFLTVDHVPALLEQVRRLQGALSHPALDPIPQDGLHITIARVGDVACVTEQQLADVVTAAARKCARVDQFTLRAIPLSGSSGAVRYSIAPWQPLLEVHKSLTEAAQENSFPQHKSTDSFRPHLGIAYCNRRLSASPIRQSVSQLRCAPTVDIPVTEVRLVALSRRERAYQWRTVHAIPLAPCPGSSTGSA